LHAERLELQILQLPAEHHDRAVAAVIPGVRELEGVGARDPDLAIVVAPEAHAADRDRVVEELQLVALARGASWVCFACMTS